MVTISISVTDADIRTSAYYDPWRCPIATALFRTTGTKWRVAERLYNPKSRRSILTPPGMVQWAIAHDDRKKPGPRNFTFDFPSDVAE